MSEISNNGRPQNGFGVTALVLGIVGLPFMFACGGGIIASVLTLIFGWLGLKRAQAGVATNKGMAVAGLVLGVIGIVWFVLVIFVFGIASIPGSTTT